LDGSGTRLLGVEFGLDLRCIIGFALAALLFFGLGGGEFDSGQRFLAVTLLGLGGEAARNLAGLVGWKRCLVGTGSRFAWSYGAVGGRLCGVAVFARRVGEILSRWDLGEREVTGRRSEIRCRKDDGGVTGELSSRVRIGSRGGVCQYGNEGRDILVERDARDRAGGTLVCGTIIDVSNIDDSVFSDSGVLSSGVGTGVGLGTRHCVCERWLR
jgi:hypothetical protein